MFNLNSFEANSPFDNNSRSYKFLYHFNPATNGTSHFLKVISENIHLIFNSSVSYYKIGVGLLNLRSETHLRWNLFKHPHGNVPLMNMLDKINQRYGADSVFFMTEGIDKK